MMIEQTLKSSRDKMTKTINDQLVEQIKESLQGTLFEIDLTKKDERGILLAAPTIVVRIDKTKNVSISFHVTIRSDVAHSIFTKLSEIKSIKKLEMSQAFYYDDKSPKVFYGNEAEEKIIDFMKKIIINDFVNEQTQLIILKNFKTPYVC
jgi:hypothetical protein